MSTFAVPTHSFSLQMLPSETNRLNGYCVLKSISTSSGKQMLTLIPLSLIYLNFHPLEVVSRYRDPQLQVGENYLYLFNLRSILCKY